jgi:hypothetical protein
VGSRLIVKNLDEATGLEASEIRNLLYLHYQERLTEGSYDREVLRSYMMSTYNDELLQTIEGVYSLSSDQVSGVLILGETRTLFSGEVECHVVELVGKTLVESATLLKRAVEIAGENEADYVVYDCPVRLGVYKELVETMEKNEFQADYSILRKEISVRNADTDFIYMKTPKEYESFAYRCLIDGFFNSYGANKADISTFVHETYKELNHASRLSYIGMDAQGTPVGHGLVELETPFYSRSAEARLLDIFVLEPYKNHGVSTSMHAFIEACLAKLQIKFMEGTLVTRVSSSPRNLTRGLLSKGWVIERTIFKKKLKSYKRK